MEYIKIALGEFVSTYGATLLYTAVTFIAGYIGMTVKSLYKKYVDTQIKESVVKTCVKAVEQIYKDLHGEEKLQKALESASEMLIEKGINITELELRMLIEAAVAEFNDAFNRPNSNDKIEDGTDMATEVSTNSEI